MLANCVDSTPRNQGRQQVLLPPRGPCLGIPGNETEMGNLPALGFIERRKGQGSLQLWPRGLLAYAG